MSLSPKRAHRGTLLMQDPVVLSPLTTSQDLRAYGEPKSCKIAPRRSGASYKHSVGRGGTITGVLMREE
jgi:hypothetical protein